MKNKIIANFLKCFQVKVLMFINCFFFIDSVRTVYNEFVLSLALKRHSWNAADGTAASFTKWSESTRHNKLLKRKYSDTMDASNQIMPTKRRIRRDFMRHRR